MRRPGSLEELGTEELDTVTITYAEDTLEPPSWEATP